MANNKVDHKLGTYIEGISNDKYHSDKAFLSSSQVKLAVDSHANFRWLTNYKEEKIAKWDANSSLDFGSLVHAMVLEPETVEKDFAFIDLEGRNMRLKENQKYKALFLDKWSNTRIVLTNEAKERARTCAGAMIEHEFINKLLNTKGRPEVSGYFKDDFYKRDLRFRPDYLIETDEEKDIILDVKTTRDIESFVRDAKYKYSYDLSAYMYMAGHKAITGKDTDFYFAVVENTGPYRVSCFKAGEDFLIQGRKKYARAMANIDIAMGARPEYIRWQEVDFEEI